MEGEVNLFCDNEFVYKIVSFSESQLKKKYQYICFNRARECMAANTIIVHKFDTNNNLAGMLTKSLPGWKRVNLRICIVYTYNTNIS